MSMQYAAALGWDSFLGARIYKHIAPLGLTHKIRCGQELP
jgi:hypothetical protein